MLLANGAEELYCGLVPEEWVARYSGAIWLNRRSPAGGNLRSFSDLARIVGQAHGCSVPVFVTLNAQSYTASQLPLVLDLARRYVEEAGVDGLIVPDMPPDEAGPLKAPADAAGLPLIFLLAPTSTADRRKLVAKESHGFVYYVSLTGITGAKLSNVGDIGQNIEKLRKVSATPVAVGFGVATPEDAAKVSKMADGVIVGSAIVKRIASHQQDPAMVKHVAEFVRSLKAAMVPA